MTNPEPALPVITDDEAAVVRQNPFSEDVCAGPYGLEAGVTVESLNADLFDQLLESVESRASLPPILLTAPRAGYGKTHLLGRVVAAAEAQAVLVPLAFKSGDTPGIQMLTRRGLEALALAALPGQQGWTRLRESCGGVLAVLMRGLIEEGSLPCANHDQARQVLAGPVREVFDSLGTARAIGSWLEGNSCSLLPLISRAAAMRVPVGAAALEPWLYAFISQAVKGGQAGIAEMRALAAENSVEPVWLLLLGLWRPVVLLVDHLDGYYRNTDAGVAIASLLMDLVEGHGIHVLLSLNQDVWQATFGHHLPSALEDRLTASRLLLRGLREADAAELLRLRLESARVGAEEAADFTAFLDVKRHFLGRPVGSVSARAFLRHCARQWELFQNSPAAAPDVAAQEIAEDDGQLVFPVPVEPPVTATPVQPVFPMAEDGVSESDIFDAETTSEVRLIAEGLAEPVHALPQDTPATDAKDGKSADSAGPVLDFPSAAGSAVVPAADAFVKLRKMLHRLREPEPEPPFPLPAAPVSAQPSTAPLPPPSAPEPAPSPPKPDTATGLLMGRFGALRLQMQAEATSQQLDYAKLTDLVRLAGRRFPLVRLSEHELPGMTGRHTLCWTLKGLEIIFGLAAPSDTAYWRTLSGFCAGRVADLEELAVKEQSEPPRLKWVVFVTEREQDDMSGLEESGVIPEPLRALMDRIRLDTGEVAALYAMQRIIKEAESGVLSTEPAQVMSVLARELDFFWKQVTRM